MSYALLDRQMLLTFEHYLAMLLTMCILSECVLYCIVLYYIVLLLCVMIIYQLLNEGIISNNQRLSLDFDETSHRSLEPHL